MSLDFPRAWELARAAPSDAHHPECSYMQTDGALLCDIVCPVMTGSPEFQCPALHSHGGAAVHGECPGHEPDPAREAP